MLFVIFTRTFASGLNWLLARLPLIWAVGSADFFEILVECQEQKLLALH